MKILISVSMAIVFGLVFVGMLFTQTQTQPSLPPPVPVAQPQVPPPKEGKVVPIPDEPTNVIMPGRFIKNRIEAMSVSTTGYINVQGLKVDSARRCWLDPQYPYGKKNEKMLVLITKDENGYHVFLEDTGHQWEAADFDSKGWLPVKSVRASK